MNWTSRLLAVVLLHGTIVACSGGMAKPVGLDVAIRGVEDDLKAASGVSLDDLASDDATQQEDVKQAILRAQCFYGRANPIVPVMTKEFTLTLQGTFTGQGHFVVFGIPVPSGSIGISAAEALQQTLALPISFTSISSLPDVYLQQKASYVKDVPESKKGAYLEEAFQTREALQAGMKGLIETYSEERCRTLSMESRPTVRPVPPGPTR
jgi:hypothetical protein